MTNNIEKEIERTTIFFSNLVRRTQVIERFLSVGSMFAAFLAIVNLPFHNLMMVAVTLLIAFFCVISQFCLSFVFSYYGNKSIQKLNALIERAKIDNL